MTQQNNSMAGKVCLVTGANTGLGKITARELAKMGATVIMVARSESRGKAALGFATVIMVARSESRGKAALADVQQASGSSQVHLMLADLSSQDSTRQLAEQFKAQYNRL
ncbi:MAG: SDR family NAD(P)-dependent oxidoreductase, partial [Anaerolineales bacterium]|nr:SDR family NAD(P)-dependent oxidoreductase [Anaerolineales bacterium]